jgi:hypothetical protein
VIKGFRRDVHVIGALQGYYVASSGKGLPLDAALLPEERRMCISSQKNVNTRTEMIEGVWNLKKKQKLSFGNPGALD